VLSSARVSVVSAEVLPAASVEWTGIVGAPLAVPAQVMAVEL